MTYVIKHKPTGLFLGSDEDHIISDDAMQFEQEGDAKEHISLLIQHGDFEVTNNDPARKSHIKLVANKPPNDGSIK
ncbi:MAG: hypothetical protein JKY52_00050 [Flavobacteriales bacterium]|nr:hypothetical protein [Flavobacteriales bacterium]